MKYILPLLMLLFVFDNASGQNENLKGMWSGSIDVGIKLRLVFHLEMDKAGNYTATMDSPDQNAKGIPVSDVLFRNDSLLLQMSALKASYSGKMVNDSVIKGVFKQGPATLSLELKKTDFIAPLIRPQTPVPPFAYKVEDVEYDNENKTVHLGATLTMPNTGSHFPAVILISGSGQQDRDETIAGHKPFAVLADQLTKLGFAVLRVDDRGIGKSTGDLKDATSADFADDVSTSLKWLKGRNEIDKDKIGFIGHSEGGLIALLVAAEDPSIGFIISLAGPGINGTRLMAEQNKALLLRGGLPVEAANAYKELYEGIAGISFSASTTDSAIRSATAYILLWKMSQTQSILSALNLQKQDAGNKLVEDLVPAFRQSWTKYFMMSDAPSLLEKTNAKILALFGSEDLQVVPDENLAGMKQILEKRTLNNYSLKILPGLNHLFQHCKTCTIAEYGELEETFSPVALKEINEWLIKNIKEK